MKDDILDGPVRLTDYHGARVMFILGSFNESTKFELVTTGHFMIHIRFEANVVFIGPMKRTRVLDIKFLDEKLTQSY